MLDGWRQVTLGEVATLHYGKGLRADERVPGGVPVAGSSGQFAQHDAANVTTQQSVVVGRKGTAGSVTWFDTPAWVTDTAYWAEPREGLDLRCLRLLLENADLPSHTAQTGVPGLNRERAYAIPITLPPPGDQRRIVDLIAAVDDAVEAAEGEASAARTLLDALLSDAPMTETRPIGTVASLGSGASWGKAAVREGPDEDATPVITIANTKPTGAITGTPTYVTGLPKKTRLLQPGSIIVIRTNGNHDRIGNVYRATEAEAGAAVSAFQFIVDALDARDADHLYWMMRSSSFQARVTDAASGSTGLGNIAVSKVRQMEVPWPATAAERQTLAFQFDSAHRGGEAARDTAEALRALRSNLLTALLSGEHEIPSSYDRLIKEAA